MITSYTLFSGSSGNSILVKSGKTEILIDAGCSCRAIEQALISVGSSLDSVKSIFITQEHSDHTSALEMISKKRNIPVHITYPSYDALVREKSYLKRSAIRHEIEFEAQIGELNIKSFKIPHDSAQNVGYVITDKESSLGIATDIGHITEEIGYSLKGCEYVILESNHDVDMLNNGFYPAHLKRRILSENGHLSNKNAALLACFLAENGAKKITLAHLSKENNTPSLALETVSGMLRDNNLSPELCVAMPNEPTAVTR